MGAKTKEELNPEPECGAHLRLQIGGPIGTPGRTLTATCHLPPDHEGPHRVKVGNTKKSPIQTVAAQEVWIEWAVDERPICSACGQRVRPKRFKDGLCLDCGGYCEACQGTGRRRELWLLPLEQCPPCPDCRGSGKRSA